MGGSGKGAGEDWSNGVGTGGDVHGGGSGVDTLQDQELCSDGGNGEGSVGITP